MGTKLIRPAKCCAHCRRHTIRLIRRVFHATLRQTHCQVLGRDVAPTEYCFRFRWAIGLRPPTPEKVSTVMPQGEPPVPMEPYLEEGVRDA